MRLTDHPDGEASVARRGAASCASRRGGDLDGRARRALERRGRARGARARRATTGVLTSATLPGRARRACGRRCAAARRATCCSRPRPGYEFLDWGGADHVGGGSHGSLHGNDSLGALLWCGTGPDDARRAAQWSLRDVVPDGARPLRRAVIRALRRRRGAGSRLLAARRPRHRRADAARPGASRASAAGDRHRHGRACRDRRARRAPARAARACYARVRGRAGACRSLVEPRRSASRDRPGDRRRPQRAGARAWTGIQVEWTMARGYPGAFGAHGRRAVGVAAAVRAVPRAVRAAAAAAACTSTSPSCSPSASRAPSFSARRTSSSPCRSPIRRSSTSSCACCTSARARAPAPPPRTCGLRHAPRRRRRRSCSASGSASTIAELERDRRRLRGRRWAPTGCSTGRALYGAFPLDNARGDTYGPVALLRSTSRSSSRGRGAASWDDLPAAHAAALAFDARLRRRLLLLLGRRLGGPRLGVLLA